MARIVSATFALAAGTVSRQVPRSASILCVRLEGLNQGRVFAVVPDPAAPTEERKIHVVQAGVDLPADPEHFAFIGLVTTAAGADWLVFERIIG